MPANTNKATARLRTLLAVREHFACNRNSHVSLRADFSVSRALLLSFALHVCVCVCVAEHCDARELARQNGKDQTHRL